MKNVRDYLLNELGISSGDKLIVAVSGGPDSMALLHVLSTLKKNIDIEIVCAHVNHNTGREGQLEEQNYVENYCSLNDIICETLVITEYNDDNFENEARTKRYDYFEDLINKYKAKYLFTAHHGDDLIETILMRLVRGSTLRGYSGFSKIVDREKYKIVRPFMELTKDEIIEYNENNKIKYFVDKTNAEDVHTRNRYRKYILPALKKEDLNVHLKFLKYSKILLECSEYLDKIVLEKIKNLYKDNVLNIPLLLEEEKIIQMKIIYFILEQIYQEDLMLINDKHAEIVYEMIESSKSSLQAHLPNNIRVVKSYDSLSFEISEKENLDYEIEMVDFVHLPNGKSIKFIKETTNNTNFICRLDSKEVKLPLYVRTRRNGDKLSVKGMEGRKKVNDIFIDNKIPMKERTLWPIVVDSDGRIVWLPGLKKTKFDKTKAEKCDIILKYY